MTRSSACASNSEKSRLRNCALQGLSFLVGEEELLLSCMVFPWFPEAPVSKIANIEKPGPHHLPRPDPDADLSIESMRHPEEFPCGLGTCLTIRVHLSEIHRCTLAFVDPVVVFM